MNDPVQDIMAYFATLRLKIGEDVPREGTPFSNGRLPLLPDQYAYVID